MSDSDRRSTTRVTINKQFDSFDQFVNEYVTNVSGSGVFVKSDTPLPVGTEITLKFSVVLDQIESIEGTGVVVRVQDDPRGMGVVFKELDAYSKDLVERLLVARR
ncbi:MAG TPA: PilZ domain-containing protein [Polyangiaceae bacterium]